MRRAAKPLEWYDHAVEILVICTQMVEVMDDIVVLLKIIYRKKKRGSLAQHTCLRFNYPRTHSRIQCPVEAVMSMV